MAKVRTLGVTEFLNFLLSYKAPEIVIGTHERAIFRQEQVI
jgi:hypothetical protein